MHIITAPSTKFFQSPKNLTEKYPMTTLRLLAAFFFCALASAHAGDAPLPAKADLHVYLLAGEVSMTTAADGGEALEGCYLLDSDGQWVPASGALNRFSPVAGEKGRARAVSVRGFVEALRQVHPTQQIGLVVNAADGAVPEEWHMKSKYYRSLRKRALQAKQQGTLMGVLWHAGPSRNQLHTDIDHLKTIIALLRADLGILNLPVVLGEVPGNPSLNVQFQQVAQDVHACAFAGMGQTPEAAKARLGEKGIQLLGHRFAEQMLALQGSWQGKIHRRLSPSMPIIDAHIHAMANKPGGLDPAIAWMDRHGVEQAITSPIGASRPANAAERQMMLANHAKYPGRIHRMALIEPGECATVEEAVAILEKEIAAGAVAFGEHYGRGLMFDDPQNLILYAACEKVGLPVMFHIDPTKNMVEQGMRRVERVLEQFPDCKIIAHAYWWLQFPDGTCERMMARHPNLYADVSGLRVGAMLNRDRGQTHEFLLRYADRVLFCSDAGWWSFDSTVENRELQFSFFEELDLPEDVLRKIYRDNALRLFGLKENQS